MDLEKYYNDPVLIAQKLIQFSTANVSEKEIKDTPEGPCIMFVKELFDYIGVESEIYYSDLEGAKDRPNLMTKFE